MENTIKETAKIKQQLRSRGSNRLPLTDEEIEHVEKSIKLKESCLLSLFGGSVGDYRKSADLINLCAWLVKEGIENSGHDSHKKHTELLVLLSNLQYMLMQLSELEDISEPFSKPIYLIKENE